MIVRNACLPLILIVCLAAVSGCATNSTTNSTGPADSLPADRYVAINEDLKTTCTITSGSYDLLPHITAPGAVFIYDGSLDGGNETVGISWANLRPENLDHYYPAVNDSFKVLYGTYYYRDVAPQDTRTGLRVRGVYSLPSAFESGFVLQSIDANGTIHGSYGNRSIVLKVGEQWNFGHYLEMKSGNGTGLDGKPFAYTASFDTTWTITNLGAFDKSNLTRYNNSPTAMGYEETAAGADPAEQ